ncbi:MAG: hypothetical protein J0L64_22890 [Acidobacteria bacterium]|nr:hypothetical protein [Acidobacteriota bacterium]
MATGMAYGWLVCAAVGAVVHLAGDVMINRELYAVGESVEGWFARYGLFLDWGKLARHARRGLPARWRVLKIVGAIGACVGLLGWLAAVLT